MVKVLDQVRRAGFTKYAFNVRSEAAGGETSTP
jgi:hypothetical protein